MARDRIGAGHRIGMVGLAAVVVAAMAAVAAPAGATSPAGAAAAPRVIHANGSIRLHFDRTVNLRALAAQLHALRAGRTGAAAAAASSPRIIDQKAASFHPAGVKGGAAKATVFPVNTAPVKGVRGFVGLTGPSQAVANGGIDLDPPDQGLCAGNNQVGEFINNAYAVYSKTGVMLSAVIPSYALFDAPSDSFFSDPRCYYDADNGHWILNEFTITIGPGLSIVAPATQYIAVSNTADALGTYSVYSFDTTDASTPNCPCFGDFDQLGVDNYGVYISTNEFGDVSGYNGVVIYATSKQILETVPHTGIEPVIFTYRVPTDTLGVTYHIAPAQTPAGATFAPDTEYFVESDVVNAPSDHRLMVYAMVGTSLLATPAPPALVSTELKSQHYSAPPDAVQKSGPIPLGKTSGEKEGELQSDFDAIQEVTYVGGYLYAELSTAVSASRVGAEWFKILPTVTDGGSPSVSATMAAQGSLQVAGQSLIYPVVALNKNSAGAIAFALSGPAYYPSAAWVAFGPSGPTGSVNVAGAGAGPNDSFTCYAAYVGPFYGGCRWGDYSMGVAMGNKLYLGTEMVPNSARDYLSNWGTYIWSLKPAG